MPVDAHHEVVGRVGADRHEGAGAERDLAAVADQDVQADGGERQDQERDQDRAEQVFAAQQRHDDEGQRQQQRAMTTRSCRIGKICWSAR